MIIGEATRSLEKAWRCTSDGKAAELPKPLIALFVNELVGLVETSQRGLPNFATDVGGHL